MVDCHRLRSIRRSNISMGDQLPLMRGSTGLNTVADPIRVNYDPETGVTDLGVAVNVVVTPTGRVGRRPGYEQQVDLNAHSLFCDGGECLFVSGTNLYLLETDFSYRVLRADLTLDRRMAYVQIGDKIYFTNDHDLGYVENGVAHAWAKATDYVGPVTQRNFEGPFSGSHLAYHGGRMYISKDKALWYSEPYAVDWYDMARNWIPFYDRIRMVKSVAGGLFVSTNKEIHFLEGLVPKNYVLRKVTTYPAYEWSDAIDYLDGSDVQGLDASGLCALWSTPEGAMIGFPDGRTKNLNKNKVIYPSNGTRGASLLKGYDLVHTIE